MISLDRLAQITQRFEYLEARMAEGGGDFAALSREYAELRPVVGAIQAWQEATAGLDEARMLRDDPEMRALADEEIERISKDLPDLEHAVQIALCPRTRPTPDRR